MRSRPFAAHALTVGALLAAGMVTASTGCGHERPRLAGDDDSDGGLGAHVGGGGGGDTFDFDSGPPPGCGVGPDGGVCGCVEVPLVGDPPNLYFVLDRSGSMNDSNKWQTVRNVVGKVVSKLGARSKFGAALYPSPNGTEICASGVEVLPVRAGGGDAALAILNATNVGASGGTPTAATLAALTSKLAALPGKTFVILATDGGPNCNGAATCDVAACIPNIESAASCLPNQLPNCCDKVPQSCLDGPATTAAVAGLKAAGIPTYVVGVPGSGPYADLLDGLAKAGGTARPSAPFYFRVDTADSAALQTALAKVAAKITASCTLPIGSTPPAPGLVNVYLDQVIVPKDPTNGWRLDGATVTLLGATCDRVLNGDALDVRIIAGCPTVVR